MNIKQYSIDKNFDQKFFENNFTNIKNSSYQKKNNYLSTHRKNLAISFNSTKFKFAKLKKLVNNIKISRISFLPLILGASLAVLNYYGGI